MDIVLPGLGDHHHDRLGERTVTGLSQKLKDAVKVTTITHIVTGSGQELMSLVSKVLGLHDATATVHPVLVATEGVDLTIVTHRTDGLGTLPRGERVGGETRMDKGHVRKEGGILKVEEVLRHLLGSELTLVRDVRRGERVDVEPTLWSQHAGRFILCHLANSEQLLLKLSARELSDVVGNKDLLGGRFGVQRITSKHRVVNGNRAPSNNR
mmetsp:Transcript_4684/g.11210  ORF Transcript_4684/g.11210 Transcript_4684/m.11210 type:complete len:211 (+) Transcript_4684:3661-4293(+)